MSAQHRLLWIFPAAVCRSELFGLGGAPTARFIGSNWSYVVENRLYNPPGLFHIVFTGEARGVTVQGIIQQFLVGRQLGWVGTMEREEFHVISCHLVPGFLFSA
jgi:hypothetical protein